MIPVTEIRTTGQLRASGHRYRTVKEEMRLNLIRKMKAGDDLFPGILGFDETVIPQLQNAILAQHDLILLGLRGQAKSRIIRMLVNLLDEYVPVIAGSELNDHPYRPISKRARELAAGHGDDTPVEWLHRQDRYGEKLATPDTSIADLIGDIDPIKAATRKLTYADEEVIHFGIIPRTNRGIFAINELPDLQPRIQVGLLNILEEQDIQIRGFNVRIPLDVLMVFTANPEDYTNRGTIITPLKDRIDSQIITHYPRTIEIGMEITRQEAWEERGDEVKVIIPHFMREIIEQIAFEARRSEYIDQKSGVSARLTRSALEGLVSAVERRALLNNESEATARISDLAHLEPAITGKVELVYEGEQEGAQNVARALVGKAVNTVFKKYFPDPAAKKEGKNPYKPVVDWFARGNAVEIGREMSFPAYTRALDQVGGLHELVKQHVNGGTPAERATSKEFVLEALHQNSVVGKDIVETNHRYTDMMGSMLSSLGSLEDDDDELDDDDFASFR